MHIIGAVIYFLIFIILATGVMFVGGVAGVVGTFHLMVQPGDLKNNLITIVSILSLLWLLLMVLRYYNKKVIKQNKQQALEAAEKEA